MDRKPNRAMIGLLALLGEIGYTEFDGEAIENELLSSMRVGLTPQRTGIFDTPNGSTPKPAPKQRRQKAPETPSPTNVEGAES